MSYEGSVRLNQSTFNVWNTNLPLTSLLCNVWCVKCTNISLTSLQVPIGFGDGADACLHKQYEQYESGSSKRLAPKCVEWLEKAEDKFETLAKREKGNDKREAFVVFATLFALSVSAAVGFMFGVLLKERDDLFSYHNRAENKKMFIIFGVAISIPVVVIIWASRRLFMLMTGAFFTGRAVQFFHQKKQDSAYSLVSGSDSGLVFAAIPVQMD